MTRQRPGRLAFSQKRISAAKSRRRRLTVESLERRDLLTAAPLLASPPVELTEAPPSIIAAVGGTVGMGTAALFDVVAQEDDRDYLNVHPVERHSLPTQVVPLASEAVTEAQPAPEMTIFSGGSGGSGGEVDRPSVGLSGGGMTAEPLASAGSPATIDIYQQAVSGGYNGPLAVKIQISGSASADDIRLVWKNQDIPISGSQFSVTTSGPGNEILRIYPLADGLVEGTETIVFSLVADAAYQIGQPDAPEFDILDGSYAASFSDNTLQNQPGTTLPVPFDCGCEPTIQWNQSGQIVLSFLAEVTASYGISDSITIVGILGTQPFSATKSFTSNGAEPQQLHFAIAFDRSLFGDDLFAHYEATVTSSLHSPELQYQLAEAPQQFSGQVFFGELGTTITGVPRIISDDSGAMISYGDHGDYFPLNLDDLYSPAPGTFSHLQATFAARSPSSSPTGYQLTNRDHSVYEFDSEGYATSLTDAQGNVTLFTYVMVGGRPQIATIESEFLTTTFTYSGNQLVAVSDTRGNSVTLAYTGNLLTSATQKDPDGSGPLPAPVTTYAYDTSSRINLITGPGGLETAFSYDTTGQFASIQQPSGSTEHYESPQAAALDRGLFSQTTTDASGIVTSTTFDQLGNPILAVNGLGAESHFQRDENGLLLKTTLADRDGEGPLEAAVFEFTYDTRGNLLTETAPDESVHSWVYHPTWNQPIESIDANGNVTLFTYDNTYPLLLSETIVVGEVDDGINLETDDIVTTFTYTAAPVLPSDPPAGLVASVTDPNGVTTAFQHDSLGQVTQTTYAVGTADEATTFTAYCLCGGVSSFTDELGNTTSYQRDELNRVTTITSPDPDGAGPLTASVTQFTFNVMGLLATESINGRVTSYAYDSQGRLTSVTQPDPDGSGPLPAPVTSYTFSAAGELLSETDPRGYTTSYGYTSGLLTTIAQPDPDGAGPLLPAVATIAYNSDGTISDITDYLGNTTSFGYDMLGAQVSVTTPDPDGSGPLQPLSSQIERNNLGQVVIDTDLAGQIVTYTHDSRGNVASKTTPLGTTSYAYDSLNRVVQIDEPDPNGGPLDFLTTLFTYTPTGQIATVTTAQGTATYTYDSRNRLIKVTFPDPDGAGPGLSPWIVYTYDAAGRITSETDRLGQQTSYSYDNIGRIIKVIDAEGGETLYSYDAHGNRLSLTDPVGNTTTWGYDALNRPISETNELNLSRYFQYDAASNLSQLTDRNGRVIQYTHDYLSRPVVETWWDGQTVLRTLTYQYDAASQLTSAYDPAAAYDFTFDTLGRNTQIVHDLAALSFEITVDQTFDNLNRRTELATTIDTTADLLNSYQYDYFSRITQVSQAGQLGGNAVAEKRVEFGYDSHFSSQFSTITRYADLAGTKLVADSDFYYDAIGRMTSIDHSDSATTLAGYAFGYDAANRITQFLVAGYSAEDADYSYDGTSQLIGVDRDGTNHDEAYAFDENGNRIGGSYVVGDNNQILSDGAFEYTFDAEGNRVIKLDLASGGWIEYEWDHRNRLISIAGKNALGVLVHHVVYTYDIFDRRIVKSIDADGAGPDPAEQEIYIHDGLRSERGGAGDQVLLRLDGNGDLTDRYLHGPAVDQILAEEAITNPAVAGDVLWALTDHLGTVRDLVEYDSVNDESLIANHIVFDAFGSIVSESDPATASLFGFTGRERDAESDLQYNRARYYDAALGRWLSEDPLGFAAGDTNLVRYVGNGVVGRVDPSGLYQPMPGIDRPRGHLVNRPLTAGEIELLRGIFGHHLNTEDIVIVNGTLFPGNYAMVPRSTPYFPEGVYCSDFSQPNPYRHLFIHEMVHVLQAQQGNTNWADFLLLVVAYRARYADSYHFEWSDLGRPLYEFNMEQQARIIEYYYTNRIPPEHLERCRQTIGDFQTQRPAGPLIPQPFRPIFWVPLPPRAYR